MGGRQKKKAPQQQQKRKRRGRARELPTPRARYSEACQTSTSQGHKATVAAHRGHRHLPSPQKKKKPHTKESIVTYPAVVYHAEVVALAEHDCHREAKLGGAARRSRVPGCLFLSRCPGAAGYGQLVVRFVRVKGRTYMTKVAVGCGYFCVLDFWIQWAPKKTQRFWAFCCAQWRKCKLEF